jgi:hypothetical protein
MEKEITFGNLLEPNIKKEFRIEPKFGSDVVLKEK